MISAGHGVQCVSASRRKELIANGAGFRVVTDILTFCIIQRCWREKRRRTIKIIVRHGTRTATGVTFSSLHFSSSWVFHIYASVEWSKANFYLCAT